MRRSFRNFDRRISIAIVILLIGPFQPATAQGDFSAAWNNSTALAYWKPCVCPTPASDEKTENSKEANLQEKAPAPVMLVQPANTNAHATASSPIEIEKTAEEPTATAVEKSAEPAVDAKMEKPLGDGGPADSKTPEAPKADTQPSADEKANQAPIKTANDDEVLNNILGIPQEQKPANAPARERQKPFSFLDPEASSVLAPEFDYGVYSMNMRILDDYRKRVMDALQASRQLSLNLPEEQVMGLLQEVDILKKQFGDLYLNNQVQPGLDAYQQARKRSLQALALTSQSPKVEGRAIWLDRGTIVKAGGPMGMKMLMQRLHQAGMNIIYFEALNAGFPMYRSDLLKPNPLVNGWDPLQVAVEEGHKLGMEVHAWVWVFAVGNRRHNDLIGKPSAYAGPVLEDIGMMSEAMRGRDGSLNMDIRQNEYWLSPASPKGREFLLNVYKELLTRYPVDGLHLDYIRYPFQASSTRMGFEPVGKERFTQSTGMSLDKMDDYTLRVWIAWKTHQVSSFVQQVSEMARKLRPEIKLSAAVFPMKREARIVAIQQDWETWVDNGWIDVLNPMSYTSSPEKLQSIYEAVCHSPQKHVLVYPGISLKYLDGGSLIAQLDALRQKGSLGSTMFAGVYLDEEKINLLGKGPFKDGGTLPPHRNALQALKLLAADYDQKLAQLYAVGGIPEGDVNGLRTALGQLTSSLAAIEAGQPEQKHQAQQSLQTLQSLTQSWTNQDRVSHPYRAAYFDALTAQLDGMMGYLIDKSVPPTTAEAFSIFKKQEQPLPPENTKAIIAEPQEETDLAEPEASADPPEATPNTEPALPLTAN